MRGALLSLLLLPGACALSACGGGSGSDAGLDGGDDGGADAGVDSGRDAGPPRTDLGIDAALPPLDYTDPALWLCRPGRADDCTTHDMTATEVFPDGGLEVQPFDAGTPPADVDCFYLYPTADVSGLPGNHTDLTDPSPIVPELISTAVRFRGLCNLWAPLYRQATVGAFAHDATPWLDAAYADVLAAWDEYAAHLSAGHRIVLLAHSQGSFHMRRLIQQRIDADPAMRARVVVAVMLGGDVLVPDGATVGGSFANMPLCTSDAETHCVIAYRSYGEGFPPPNVGGFFSRVGTVPAGQDVACTGPAIPDDAGVAALAGSYILSSAVYPSPTLVAVSPPAGVTTGFIRYHARWSAACAREDGGTSYLKITETPGDARPSPVNFSDFQFSPAVLGLHPLDYELGMDDLIRLVSAKIAAPP